MTARRRIAVVTGSRADYGLLRGILTRLKAMDDVSLSIIACGMHLVPRFGETWRAIEADGFSIAAKVDLQLQRRSRRDGGARYRNRRRRVCRCAP